MRSWLKTAVRKLLRRHDGVPSDRQYASGGYIGAFDGSRNDVPIFIHPGDYRISLEAAKLLGRDFLEELNRPDGMTARRPG